MTWKKFLIVLAIILTILYFLDFNKIKKQFYPKESIEKIDSLGVKIDSIYVIKDSILERVNTVYVKLEDNKKHYEENFIRVINNDASEDYVFFCDYIKTNRARLDSIGKSL